MRIIHRGTTLIRRIKLLIVLASLIAACGGNSPDVSVGDPAPGFTLPTATGDEVSLADYTGKQPVLLFFHMAVG